MGSVNFSQTGMTLAFDAVSKIISTLSDSQFKTKLNTFL
jgi:hypothetical protein